MPIYTTLMCYNILFISYLCCQFLVTVHCNTLNFKTYKLLYVPPVVTDRNSVFRPQCIYVFCMDLKKKQRLFHYTTLIYLFL